MLVSWWQTDDIINDSKNEINNEAKKNKEHTKEQTNSMRKLTNNIYDECKWRDEEVS
jgi:hypothetical protein